MLDFKLLFEGSPDILLVLLPDAPRFTMVAATEARFAATHTTKDTLGQGIFELFPDNPDDPNASGTNNLRASLERVLATRAPDTMAVQKYDIRGPDGTFQAKYWSPKNIPVLGAGGEVVYILHRVEDVTELVHASEVDEELRDRTRQMEREVLARSRELSEANRGLRDANARLGELDRAKTAFFSNVSHEFRTPLTLILGPIEKALEGSEGLHDDELAAVHRNALRLLRLVNSLLDFSRLEAGGVKFEFAPTDLAALTAGLAGAFGSLMEEAGLRLVVDCPPLPDAVYVDVTQWEKIVTNLISNAFKFTFEGEIFVGLSWRGDRAELTVKDTGTGIPKEELPRIFERFHRVEGARGRSFEGTGIGLALVHELARAHGGKVSVESELGRGTTFRVEIPSGVAHLPRERLVAARAPVENGGTPSAGLLEAKQWVRSRAHVSDAPKVPGDARESTPSRGRVLVVDDNADMRDYVARLLSEYWEIEVAEDGKAALARALSHPPDLVLSDVMMPELDGVGLLRGLRADPRTATVPVILVSARAGEEARLAGLETGADDYLVKPFAAREVVTRVRTHLEMAKARRAAYEELKRAQAQLVHSAKMASLGELVAGIAHEINNPLAFALGHVGTVGKSLTTLEGLLPGARTGPAGEAWQRVVDRLRETELGLRRIRDLVLKLRTFSRLDEGEEKRVSIRESIDSVLMILQHRLKGGVHVTTELGEPDEIVCFASLLNQAVMNLVTNALDAVGNEGTIAIRTEVQNGWFELSVTDSGAGVPEGVRTRIFEPFFTTKAPGEGTGLGLSITDSIAKKHGGRVELVPNPAGGTIARLAFPLRR
ncbi:MAG TPA: ATP-binding protein [Polyangiaceae bacterium]|nr:ATP-binding protein [Polyangiaceae bacterium]